jgi:hypothetical protein
MKSFQATATRKVLPGGWLLAAEFARRGEQKNHVTI